MDMNKVTMDRTLAMKVASRVFNIVLILTLVFACLLAVVATLSDRDQALWGLRTYVITSGSMEPKIHTGSVVIVKDTDASAVQVGDVITYQNGNDYVAHRVIQKLPDGSVVTKGDANDVADAPVPQTAVSGRVVFTLPYLGMLSSFVHSLTGFLLLIVFPACLLLGMYLRDLWADDTKTKAVGMPMVLVGLFLCASLIPGIEAYYADDSGGVEISITGPARPEGQPPVMEQQSLIVEGDSDQQLTDLTDEGPVDPDAKDTDPVDGTTPGEDPADDATLGGPTTTTTTDAAGSGDDATNASDAGGADLGDTAEDDVVTPTGTTLAP